VSLFLAAVIGAAVGASLGFAAARLRARHLEGRRTVRDADRSERRFRSMVERGWDIIVLVDREGSIHYVSPAVEMTLGVTPDELMGGSLFTRIVPEDRDQAMATFESLKREPGASRRSDFRLSHRDGAIRWVETVATNLLDDPDVQGIVVVSRDVTRRRLVEMERALLARGIEQSEELVIVTDVEGRIQYANPAFERITGYARSEVMDQTPRLLKSGKQGPSFYDELWSTISHGHTWRGRFRNRRKDGALYDQEAVISPVRDETGRIVNYVGVARDVTRERELEAQLQQSQKLEAVGHLTGGIAHDLNNLLSVVMANAEMLILGLGDHADLLASASDLHAAGRRAARTVKQLLGFSRAARLELEPVDLPHLVKELSSLISRLIPETIRVELAVGVQVPPVMADPNAVEQTVVNLITNARDAMPMGGTLSVEVGLSDRTAEALQGHPGARAGKYVWVSVSDTGLGMDEATQRKIFEPFFTTKPAGSGTGLGLAVTYGLVRQQGGHVEVVSAPGSGTRVALFFPAAAGVARNAEKRAPPTPSLPQGSGETLLVVEDEAPLRRTAIRVLERHGYRVLTAQDGEEALELARLHRGHLALVICDMVMPHMDGPTLLKTLRHEGHTVPFVFTSGYAEGPPRESAVPGGYRFLPKPWTIDGLVNTVWQVLHGDQETDAVTNA
jgi:two-component system cell cycle sensor histidine kinase/response regulator CckA